MNPRAAQVADGRPYVSVGALAYGPGFLLYLGGEVHEGEVLGDWSDPVEETTPAFLTHTTDAAKVGVTRPTRSHTTDAIRKASLDSLHTTDAIKEIQGGRTHSTDAILDAFGIHNLTVTTINSTTLELQWDDTATALEYQVERDGVVIAQVDVSYYLDEGLSPSTTYSYRVRALRW